MASTDFKIRNAVIGELPRTQQLDLLEAWYNGRAYSVGLNAREYAWEEEFVPDAVGPDGGKVRIPFDHRRPYQYNLAAYIVDTSTAWLCGSRRFPTISVEQENEAGEDDSSTGDWIGALREATNLEATWLQVARNGGKGRTAVAVFKVVEGYPRIELLPAKYCTRTLGPDGISVTYLREQYKAPASYFEDLGYEGLSQDKDYWYRREFTPDAELVYHLVEVSMDGKPPVFEVDEERSVRHELGVLAAVWIKNLPSDDPIDGRCSYEPVLDLLDPVNMLMSVSHRSIKKMSDPTLALTNLQEANQVDEFIKKIGSSGGGLVTAPGGAEYLEMEGSGQAAAKEWVDRFRQAIAEVSRVVNPDPEKLQGAAQSGYALEILHGPLTELVGELRSTYGPALLRFVRLMLKLVRAVLDRGDIVYLPKKAEGTPNPDAELTLTWGRFFEPTPQDVGLLIGNAVTAVQSGFLSEETAVGIIAPLFGVTDVQAERDRIAKERQAREGGDHSLNEVIAKLQAAGKGEPEGDEGGQDA